MQSGHAKYDRTISAFELNQTTIGEADIELQLRMEVSEKIVQELFEHIDHIKDKEIPYGMHVVLGGIGMVVLLGVALAFDFFIQGFAPTEVIFGILFVIFILYEIAIYIFFVQNASKNASTDAKLLAKKYKEITEERMNYRGMRKTFNRMLQFKTSRSIKERNKSFLRASNLLRLESLRLFSTEFDEKSFKEINARIQEIILLSSENLARLHSANLSKESYLSSRSAIVGRNFYIHSLFSSTVILNLLVRLQTQKSSYSTRMHSMIAEDNVKETLKQMNTCYGPDHKIWEDIAKLADNEEWKSNSKVR